MKNKPHESLFKRLFLLGKFTVILPVSFTAFTAYFLAKPFLSADIFLLSLGILLSGISAASLNQILERKSDALMPRTQKRPLPAGRLSVNTAILFALICFVAGMAAVYAGGNILAVILTFFNFFWYIAVYTPLKRKTAFAVIPGSLTGAIPPLAGWTAAGGDPTALPPILMAFILFMGQIPHFWLLSYKYGKEYQDAGLPNLTTIFAEAQIRSLNLVWVSAALISSLLLVFFEIIHQPLLKYCLFFLVISGIVLAILHKINSSDRGGKLFIFLNIYYLLLMIVLIIDRMIRI